MFQKVVITFHLYFFWIVW